MIFHSIHILNTLHVSVYVCVYSVIYVYLSSLIVWKNVYLKAFVKYFYSIFNFSVLYFACKFGSRELIDLNYIKEYL